MSNEESNCYGQNCSIHSMNQTFYTSNYSTDYHTIIHKQWQH